MFNYLEVMASYLARIYVCLFIIHKLKKKISCLGYLIWLEFLSNIDTDLNLSNHILARPSMCFLGF
jgi:hypothetical protein